MNAWRRFHRCSAWIRIPVQLAAFAGVLLLVLFPRPWLVVTLFQRLGNLNALLEPHHPALAPLELEVRARLPADGDLKNALEVVEGVVLRAIPYAHDWETHGVMEFLPTVDEVFVAGREDCDGRAVVAASLLRRMGYQAELAADYLHMWVATPHGAVMGPTSVNSTIRSGTADAPKSQFQFGWTTVRQFTRGVTYGVGVFPLLREVIIVLALILITVHPAGRAWRGVLGAGLLAAALALLRYAADGVPYAPRPYWHVLAGIGWALAVTGWLLLALRDRDRRPCSAAAPPE